MVTLRLEVKTGLIGGHRVEVTVTRDDLPTAIACVLRELARARVMPVADVFRALRVVRGESSPAAGTFHHGPVLSRKPWGLVALAEMLRAASVVVPRLVAQASGVADQPAPEAPPASAELQPMDLTGVRRSLDRRDAPRDPG